MSLAPTAIHFESVKCAGSPSQARIWYRSAAKRRSHARWMFPHSPQPTLALPAAAGQIHLLWLLSERLPASAWSWVGVGVAINVLYLSHTFLVQILCPLVFPCISLLAAATFPLFCAFYSTFAPAFSQTHFCGAAQEYKWSKMKKRGRQLEEIDSEAFNF